MCIDFSFLNDSTFWTAFSGIFTAIMAFLTWRNLVLIRKEKEANIVCTIIAHRNNGKWPCYYFKFTNVGGQSTLFSFTLPKEFIDAIPLERPKECLQAVNGKDLYLEAKSSKYYVISNCDTAHMEKDAKNREESPYQRTKNFLDQFMDYQINITISYNKRKTTYKLILRWFDSQATVFDEPLERIAIALRNNKELK